MKTSLFHVFVVAAALAAILLSGPAQASTFVLWEFNPFNGAWTPADSFESLAECKSRRPVGYPPSVCLPTGVRP